jgi:hypothetical protein
MKFFVKNLMVFGTFCVALVLLILGVEKSILNNQHHFRLPAKDKYIFLGHSHTQMALNDSLVDSSINLASAGEAYFYTYIKLNKILESNDQQKVVFIAYSNNSIVSEMNGWIWDDIHILDRYRLYSAFTRFNEMKVLYKNNPSTTFICNVKSIVNNFYYIFKLKNISEDNKMGGYIYLVRDKTDSLLQTITKYNEKITEDTTTSVTNIVYLKKIIEVCRAKGVPVFLIRNPLHPAYRRIGNEPRFQKIRKEELGDTELLDFKDFPLQNSDYGDLEHLNYRGAKKYSLFINKLIKEGLLEKKDKQKFIQDQMALEQWEK